MSLIDKEYDTTEVLNIEDQAIRDAENPKPEESAIPTGGELAQLIESLTSGTSALHEG